MGLVFKQLTYDSIEQHSLLKERQMTVCGYTSETWGYIFTRSRLSFLVDEKPRIKTKTANSVGGVARVWEFVVDTDRVSPGAQVSL